MGEWDQLIVVVLLAFALTGLLFPISPISPLNFLPLVYAPEQPTPTPTTTPAP